MGSSVKSMNDLFKKVYDGKFGMVVLRPKSKDLSAFSFEEKDGIVIYQDANGDAVPLDKVIIETEETTYKIKALHKNPLSELMCTPLTQTENYYVVRK